MQIHICDTFILYLSTLQLCLFSMPFFCLNFLSLEHLLLFLIFPSLIISISLPLTYLSSLYFLPSHLYFLQILLLSLIFLICQSECILIFSWHHNQVIIASSFYTLVTAVLYFVLFITIIQSSCAPLMSPWSMCWLVWVYFLHKIYWYKEENYHA